MAIHKNGKLVIISGPSSVGKSTICRELLKRYKDVFLSVSVTTRPRAAGEVEGRDYHFVGADEFKKLAQEGYFLEHAEVFGNMYGTPRNEVDRALAEGKTVLLEIDVKGARQVRQMYPQARLIFILPPSQKDLVERMNGRARENADSAKIRLQGADDEIAAAWRYYNNMVINDELPAAVSEVAQIAGLTEGNK